MKLRNVLIVYANLTTKEQELTLQTVKRILKKYNINYVLAKRNRLSYAKLKNKDLIVAVGGDGTFLRAAQFIKNQILFGVNADVKDKEGFFMQSDRRDFDVKFKKIINNKFEIKKLPRLEAYIDGKKIDALALNEFFAGPRKSYHSAKYALGIGKIKERQKSSGILVTTPTGSYAWAKSCCNKTLPLNSKRFQFVVREPYEGKVFKNYRLKYGVLDENEKVSIYSEMLDGILTADSVGKEYDFKCESKAMIRLSKNNLSAIWFGR